MSLNNKKIAILTADWFEESEVLYPQFRLKGEGAEVKTFSFGGNAVTGKGGLGPIPVDGNVSDIKLADFDACVIPGGFAPDMVRRSPEAMELIRQADAAGKPLAFICHGLWVGVTAGILNGRTVTAVPVIKPEVEGAGAMWSDDRAVVDKNLVTAQIPNDLEAWMKKFIDVVSQG